MPGRKHNTQTDRDRRKLVADFERRLRYGDETGNRRSWFPRRDSLAWVVHPLADEHDLLAELGIPPEARRSADAYWRHRDNVCFVTVHSMAQGPADSPYVNRPPGIHYRFDRAFRQAIFDVILPRDRVSSAALRYVLNRLAQLIEAGALDSARSSLEVEPGRWLAREQPLADW
jgi:hypothetical protein